MLANDEENGGIYDMSVKLKRYGVMKEYEKRKSDLLFPRGCKSTGKVWMILCAS